MHPYRRESLKPTIRVQNVRMLGRMKIQTAAYTNVCEDLNPSVVSTQTGVTGAQPKPTIRVQNVRMLGRPEI